MNSFLLMLLMCLMTSGGQVLIKKGLNKRTVQPGLPGLVRSFFQPYLVAGMLLVLGAPLLYIQVLRQLGLSGAYGLNGLSYIFVYALSRLVLKEKGSCLHAAGLILIATGVFVWSI